MNNEEILISFLKGLNEFCLFIWRVILFFAALKILVE